VGHTISKREATGAVYIKGAVIHTLEGERDQLLVNKGRGAMTENGKSRHSDSVRAPFLDQPVETT
jgi:hypothetical protein